MRSLDFSRKILRLESSSADAVNRPADSGHCRRVASVGNSELSRLHARVAV